MIEKAKNVIEGKQRQVVMDLKIRNEDRTFGATLSNYISL